jgi:hypothetical protein
MNTKTKGRNAEKEAGLLLKNRGYKVELVKPSNKFGSVDFFDGMFDGFGYNKHEFIFFQVKCNTTQGWIKKAKLWLLDNANRPPVNSKIVLFVRKDGKGGKKVEWVEYII